MDYLSTVYKYSTPVLYKRKGSKGRNNLSVTETPEPKKIFAHVVIRFLK